MRFTIKLKLGLAFGLVIVLLIGAATLGVTSLGSQDRQGPLRRDRPL